MKSFIACFLLPFTLLQGHINDEPRSSYWWPWSSKDKASQSSSSAKHSFRVTGILNLENALAERVIGQPYAVRALADMMMFYSAGIHNKEKPIGCFLFIGSTGVGKTELAKALASHITYSSAQFLRLNMSEFNNDRVGLDRLIGMPWGYMNNEKGGELTNKILKNPYSIVLLDEFEKADEKVRLLFLHIFDEGYFSSAKGEYVDCRNCIFIATTNEGSEVIKNGWSSGKSYEEIMHDVEPKLISKFSPELYGRMEPVLFHSINRNAMVKIIHLKLEELSKKIYQEKNIHIYFDASLVDYVISRCHSFNNGARPILTIIKNDILRVIAKFLINDHTPQNEKLVVTYSGEAVIVIPQE